jgi:hypothetical protein
VAILDDTIAVTAIQENTHRAITGSVYFFFFKTPGLWTQVAKHSAWDDETGNHFGRSLALAKDLLVVGACSGKNDGAVYVFYNSGDSDWSQGVKFQATIPTGIATVGSFALFGMAVAAAVNTIVVGAPGTSNEKGAV